MQCQKQLELNPQHPESILFLGKTIQKKRKVTQQLKLRKTDRLRQVGNGGLGVAVVAKVFARGDNDLIKYLVSKGAKVDAKTKDGDTVADMANGPIAHSLPHPDTVALLETLGSANSHNCRSDQCVVATKEEKPKEEKSKDDKSKDDKAKPVTVATSPH